MFGEKKCHMKLCGTLDLGRASNITHKRYVHIRDSENLDTPPPKKKNYRIPLSGPRTPKIITLYFSNYAIIFRFSGYAELVVVLLES